VVHRDKGDIEAALAMFRAFVQRERNDKELIAEAKRAVSEIEQEMAFQEAHKPKPPPPPPWPWQRVTGAITIGAGLGIAAVGMGFRTAGMKIVHDLAGKPWDQAASDRYDTARQNVMIGAVAIGVGAAAVAVGGVFLYLGRHNHNSERPRVVPTASRDGAGLSVQGSF
jgi:hypothetical protein